MARATSMLERFMWLAVLMMLASLAQIVGWALDREPPFRSISYTATPAQAGGVMQIDRTVHRDVERHCSAEFSRYIFDSKGRRADIAGGQYMSLDQRRALERRAPGRLSEVIPIPLGLAPGPATIYTVLQYRCNPIHALWPIELLGVLEVEILPP